MIKEQLKEAKKACRFMQNVKPEVKNKALKNISEALIQKSELIIQENQKDIAEAKNNGIKESMVDRLLLNKERIEAMAKDILKVIDLLFHRYFHYLFPAFPIRKNIFLKPFLELFHF